MTDDYIQLETRSDRQDVIIDIYTRLYKRAVIVCASLLVVNIILIVALVIK